LRFALYFGQGVLQFSASTSLRSADSRRCGDRRQRLVKLVRQTDAISPMVIVWRD
jgi:hypothetical protein